MNLEAELHKIIKRYMSKRKQGHCMEEMRALIAQVPSPEVIEAAAKYGWQHASWDWEAVKGGLDRFHGGLQFVGWRYQFTDGRWAYLHGTMDPREVHDNGRRHQKVYIKNE